ncbi:MAG: peptidase [Ignavibacteriae bacterium HGW-Ignavibacteriae-1]|jgi:lon-related putative ATP-dependent protease|nr:MAG: peptidase [Ignavibacteriae bacterium HGW-Ignavibacteriae-1]
MKKTKLNIGTATKLDYNQLRWQCPTSIFKFKTTAEINPLHEIIGQPRAVESIKLGASMRAKGYNIFVTGLSGTGRTTTVKQILESISGICPDLFDYCYVNNFVDSDKPILLKLAPGQGKAFQTAMNESINYLRRKIPGLFEEESYHQTRKKITNEYQTQERLVIENFDAKISKHGFVRGQLEKDDGTVQAEVFPVVDGEAVPISDLDRLVAEKKLKANEAALFKKYWQAFHEEIYDLARKGMKIMQEYRAALIESDKNFAKELVSTVFADTLERFENEKLHAYIGHVKEHILENLHFFIPNPNQNFAKNDVIIKLEESEIFSIFYVNVILDNSKTERAPVVIETNPTYTNLFGTIEKVYDARGFWRSDFTKIKAGSLLCADQGFLVVNATDLFQEPNVWNKLQQVLLYDKIEIQPYDSIFQLTQSHLKPESIDVNIKVIIIGGQTLYRFLHSYEKGFKKIFKINAQFDYETDKNEESFHHYARFAAKICMEENIPHCDVSAVAAIVEWGVEFAGSQEVITLKFSDVADLIRESAYFVKESKKKIISREDVEKAIESRKRRNDMTDEKIRKHIVKDTIMIDTSGTRVGIINGLTVYNSGIYSFGKPARISANVSVGTAGIINIERESDMSGRLHNKGILIISGFLREKFATKRTLSLSASIAFEQNYSGIDGDSASAAEIYAVLSATSNMPINQSIAITGSVNQKGEIQPIGGVNEKVIGFYEVCRERGFTKEHACIIPSRNVKDLMLSKEVIEDVRKGNFHIYSIDTIDDAIQLLFGLEAGVADKDGNYPKQSLYGLVDARIEEFAQILKPVKKETEKPKGTRK